MSEAATRVDALRALVGMLEAELHALKRFDVDALAIATDAKSQGLAAVAGEWAGEEITDEVRMLAEQAQRLNETARVYVNLMSANVRRRLDGLTGTQAPLYRPQMAVA